MNNIASELASAHDPVDIIINEFILKVIISYMDIETMNTCVYVPYMKSYVIPSYYEKFIQFKDTYNIDRDRHVIEAKQYNFYKPGDFDEIYVLNIYLEKIYEYNENNENNSVTEAIVSDEHKKYLDIEFHILQYFPEELLIQLIRTNFETRGKLGTYVHIEIVKYLFSVWNNPNNSTELTYWINRITSHLIETATMNPEEYYDILHNSKNPKYNSRLYYIYYTWWLYPYYPLIPDGDELILKLIDFVYLDDAQDMLLYGIYQMEPARLNSFMRKFLAQLCVQYDAHTTGKRERSPCFDIYCSGTGARSQILDILRKLYNNGYKLLDESDPNLQSVLADLSTI